MKKLSILIALFPLFLFAQEKNVENEDGLKKSERIVTEVKLEKFTKDKCIIEVSMTNISDDILEISPYTIPYFDWYKNCFFTVKDLCTSKSVEYTEVSMTVLEIERKDYVILKPKEKKKFLLDVYAYYAGAKKLKKIEVNYDLPHIYHIKDSDKFYIDAPNVDPLILNLEELRKELVKKKNSDSATWAAE